MNMDLSVSLSPRAWTHVKLPLSKSITNRVMILEALACGSISLLDSELSSYDICDDIEAMRNALTSKDTHINVGGAGTAMRFLTAYYAVQQGRETFIDGDERMRQRPLGTLVGALRHMGASIDYLAEEGFPPLHIAGRKLHGGAQHIDGGVSSQFISALLMIAPLCGGISLTIDGDIVSQSYIDMTINLMCRYGVDAKWDGNAIVVPEGKYAHRHLAIEADWSAASYWLAMKALLPESKITLAGLNRNSMQGDQAIIELMEPLGVTVDYLDDMVLGYEKNQLPKLYERNLASTPDLVPTLVVTLCLLRVPFHLTGLQSLHIKESDRIEALRVELAKLGYTVGCDHSTMSYDGNHTEPPHEVLINPHGDHRIAMAMSLAATRHRGITIKDAQVVTKSYPSWWKALCLDNRESEIEDRGLGIEYRK